MQDREWEEEALCGTGVPPGAGLPVSVAGQKGKYGPERDDCHSCNQELM